MNPYSTELRRAMTLADQILALKQNRGLVDADAMQVDAGAFFPNISRWTQMCGFRMSGPPEAGKALLQKAAARWLRAAHQSGKDHARSTDVPDDRPVGKTRRADQDPRRECGREHDGRARVPEVRVAVARA